MKHIYNKKSIKNAPLGIFEVVEAKPLIMNC